MKVEWNNCFLCLNDIGSQKEKNGEALGIHKNRAEAGFKVLFKYLLGSRGGTYEHVLQDILQAVECSANADEGEETQEQRRMIVKLCDKCERVTEAVMKLHLQLETVQMKLINGLKSVKEVVLQNSKLYGNNETTRIGLEVFEDWLNEEETRGVRHLRERATLEGLYAFQQAVYENEKDSVLIPRVFLNKFVHHIPAASAADVVKQEPVENEQFHLLQSQGLDYLDFSSESPDGFVQDNFLGFDEGCPETTVSVTVKRIRTTDNKLKSIEHRGIREKNLKPKPRSKLNEFSKEEEIQNIPENLHVVPEIKLEVEASQKKKRTAAAVASHRIQVNYDDNEHKRKKIMKKPPVSGNQKEKSVSRRANVEDKLRKRRKKAIKKNKEPKKKRGRHLLPLPSFASISDVKGARRSGRHMITFSCEECDYTTISPYRFEGHLRDHETDDKKFTCDKCQDHPKYSGKQLYDYHLAHHEGYNRMKCDVCTRVMCALELFDHMKTHVEKVFPCPRCTYCCSNRDKYLTHLREHRGNGSCDLCGLTFPNRHKLLGHYLEIHKVIEKSVCDVEGCNKSFLDPDNLRLHKKVHFQPAVCNICQKKFIDEYRLRIHLRVHTGEKAYKCNQCEESFPTRVHLQRHEIRDHGAAKFKCTNCSVEYSCKQSLIYHNMTIHDGTGIPCGFPGCDKTFGTKTLWRRHQSVHSDERKFICDECGQQLKSRQQLNKHILIHKGDKKFKCPHCDKAFIMQKYLVTHIRIHTGEKPYVCDACGKAFNQYAALYMHKRKHLGEAAPPVNPAAGRPRVSSSRAKLNFYEGIPADLSHLHSLDSNSSAEVKPEASTFPQASGLGHLQLQSSSISIAESQQMLAGGINPAAQL